MSELLTCQELYDYYSKDEVHVECRNWSDGIEMKIMKLTRKEALERFKEEIVRGCWDKIYIYGYWPVIQGQHLCHYFTGCEKSWTRGEPR